MRTPRPPRSTFYALAIIATLLSPAIAQTPAPNLRGAPREARLFPPWQDGRNNDSPDLGFNFTVPEADVLADFHGDPRHPKLALYVGGNYFFAMAPLVAAFEADHPDYRGRIYWETLPPGLLVQQLKAGGTVTVGNMTWTVRPDAYFAGLAKVQSLLDEGVLTGLAIPYVTNTLAIMIPRGNPAHVRDLRDLGRPDVRLAMPNPAFEGIVRQIKLSLGKAGGEALVQAVYDAKVKDGTTVLTHIHHRQTPILLMQGQADAGITWQSEAIFQEQAGLPIDHVAIPASENATAIYAGALVKGAAHPRAAKAWLDFIHSPRALAIFERYGFRPYSSDGSATAPDSRVSP
jgi:ABC-type molybdate transport system substrate-binding protein